MTFTASRSRTRLARCALPALLGLALYAAPEAVSARDTIPGFELIHNAPEATSLATPQLRGAEAAWCDLIENAHHEIDIEQFYLSDQSGEALEPVMRALEAAGKRGVAIHVLMEKKGLGASNPATIDRLKAIPNLEFRLISWSDVAGSGIIHAKFLVADAARAFVGSQNFDWRSLSQIDETGVLVSEPRIVRQMKSIFDQDWQAQARLAAGKAVAPLRRADYAPVDAQAFLVASPNAFDPKGVGNSETTLLTLLGRARKTIRVEVMEYSNTAFGGGAYTRIDDALRAAAARGVKVQLMIADWDLTPQRLPGLKSLAAVPNVEIRVARIPQLATGYIPYARVVHTNVMTIDGHIAWIGTSNWEGGYLDTSRNLELVFNDATMAREVGAIQARLWSSPYAHSFSAALQLPTVKHGS